MRTWTSFAVAAALMAAGIPPAAASKPAAGRVAPAALEPRVQVMAWRADDVLRIQAFVGWQVHFEFAPDERFVNLGTGDRDGIDVGAQDNHLFIKPRAERVATNITILTSRRAYHLVYSARKAPPRPGRDELVVSVRFTYPEEVARAAAARQEEEARRMAARAAREAPAADPAPVRARNEAYEFCGDASLKPIAAHDDGVQTWIRFADRSEVPAVFVLTEDGAESLANHSIEPDGAVRLHRVARQWVLRRGALVGCVRNAAYDGGGARLSGGSTRAGEVRELRPMAGAASD